MSSEQPSRRNSTFIPLALIAAGLGLSVWATTQGNRYYYAEELFGRRIKEPNVTLNITRPGRYEIDYGDDQGDLTFTVKDSTSTEDVPVKPFGLLTELFHTSGKTGASFEVSRPGEYRLTTEPWPEGAELFIDFRDTRAITSWNLLGIVVGGLMIGFGGLLFFVASYRKAEAAKHNRAESTDSENNS